MDGVDDPVEIVPYDPQWPDAFEMAASELAAALEPWVVAIEHVGSTAVPGLAAKPVIDIQVGVRSLDQSEEIVAAVEALGYEYVSELEEDLPQRRYFRRWSRGRRSHQVHLVERTDTDWWHRHVAFRDWLRTHPEARDAYAALKQRLAADHADDRVTYTDQKTAFIRTIEARALSRRKPSQT
jgi:GrpB-like predicted nucleotidyltransferase (UPF0157 family)